MKLTVLVLEEHGFLSAMLGLSLNKKQPIDNMPKVASKLYSKDKGHNKFLESMAVWLDINAPRFWWQEFDTYRVGVTKQSESTMHTILKTGKFTNNHFDKPINPSNLALLNDILTCEDVVPLKQHLPEGFLQRRIVCTNYKTLRNIYVQRKNHRLPHWQAFLTSLLSQLEYSELVV